MYRLTESRYFGDMTLQHPSAPHRQYKSMVADITVEEREAELLTDPGVKGFKESMGFGLNVIVTSYVFYLLFNECGKRLASDPGMVRSEYMDQYSSIVDLGLNDY